MIALWQGFLGLLSPFNGAVLRCVLDREGGLRLGCLPQGP